MEQTHTGDRGELLGIGDVSKICGVPVHTIRYWEREFSDYLHPTRTQGKQRRYTDNDIKRILRVKTLLWSEKFSIRGAKRILAAGTGQGESHAPDPARAIDTNRLLVSIARYATGSLVVSGTAA